MPEALASTGYKYSSSVTANSALTQLPFEANRSYGTTESGIFDFPVTFKDAALPATGGTAVQSGGIVNISHDDGTITLTFS